ncbi:hypothetical protein POM88_049130 [Heracleum sosnowskyi]|uniref:Uncharacterized protein n=1 Tax=Heracleum sosnowskyi TaxID=360622 RepID=A0AAD8GXB9_9APIA|nr:hypothetical protein POM88_049130 [Heracleum sosnowskyi]
MKSTGSASIGASTGIFIDVKRLNQVGLHVHKEWLDNKGDVGTNPKQKKKLGGVKSALFIYVTMGLENVAFIVILQLDIVFLLLFFKLTFNRLNPHGKLVMGCRKASSASNQKKEPAKSARDKPSARGDAIAKKNKSGEVGTPHHYSNKNSVSSSLLVVNKVNLADSARKCYKVENKCDAKAQGLFHPPPNDVPKIVVIDGYEIEEFEVFVVAIINRNLSFPETADGFHDVKHGTGDEILRKTEQFKFFDRAAIIRNTDSSNSCALFIGYVIDSCIIRFL